MKKTKAAASPSSGKWSDTFYVRIYELARSGLTDTQIGEALGVSRPTFNAWRQKEGVRDALDRARSKQKSSSGEAFKDHVYGRLPADIQAFWNKLEAAGQRKDPRKLIEELTRKPKLFRQQLFIQALVSSNFVMSEACRRTGISTNTVGQWGENDIEFHELIKGIQNAKKDFFESSLIDLVKRGDTSATIFANRTVNRDRGYNDKTDISVTIQGTMSYAIEDLGLPLEMRMQLLERIRERKRLQLGLDRDGNPIPDAEIIEDENKEEIPA